MKRRIIYGIIVARERGEGRAEGGLLLKLLSTKIQFHLVGLQKSNKYGTIQGLRRPSPPLSNFPHPFPDLSYYYSYFFDINTCFIFLFLLLLSSQVSLNISICPSQGPYYVSPTRFVQGILSIAPLGPFLLLPYAKL